MLLGAFKFNGNSSVDIESILYSNDLSGSVGAIYSAQVINVTVGTNSVSLNVSETKNMSCALCLHGVCSDQCVSNGHFSRQFYVELLLWIYGCKLHFLFLYKCI